MNKNLLLGLFAAVAMLCATACSQDEPTADSAVRFSLKAPATTTPLGNGMSANYLVYEVYDKDGNELTTLSSEKDAFAGGLTETITLQLTKGQTYTIAFWAQNKECGAYDYSDLKDIKVIDYATVVANNEARDAFFGSITVTVTGNFTESVELKRPFAQLNFAVSATEWDAAAAAGITLAQSSVTVSDVAAGFNALTGSVTGTSSAATFALAALPTSDILIDVDADGTEETYKHLSMNYILANDVTEGGSKSALADVEFTFTTNADNIVITSPATPLQRNWRTNIIGSLTNTAEFTVVLDPTFEGEHSSEIVEGTTIAEGVMLAEGVYYLSSAAGLQWFAANPATNMQVKLANNIDLAGNNWTPINSWDGKYNGLVFDGNGKTIQNMTITGLDANVSAYGFFDSNASSMTIKNLTFDNAQVKDVSGKSSHYAGVVMGKNYSPVTLENVHVTNSHVQNNWQCGGLVGFAETHAPVFTNCSISDSFVGGYNATCGTIFGLGAVSITMTDCKATNVQLYTDTQENDLFTGYIYGRTFTATNCVATNVTVVSEYPAVP